MTLDRIYGTSIQPRPFRDGLKYWRSQLMNVDSKRLDAMGEYSIVETVANDFGCLKVNKTASTMQIVHINKTPIKIGQYLEVKFTIRVASGSAPRARVICAPLSGSSFISGAPTQGPEVQLVRGLNNEVSAIIGSGSRPGVDLAWGLDLQQAYCGLELTGVNGGQIIVDDMKVSDVTGHFLSTNSDWVDIRDFGAYGNGKMDCREAFVRADREADGRAIFIPDGNYYVASDLTIQSPVRAYGRVTCPDDAAIMLAHRYSLDDYIDVFKDDRMAFQKALQALFRYKNHNTLDLCGRCINVSAPLDFKKITGVDRFRYPRFIQNGQFNVLSSSAWNSDVVDVEASYSDDKRGVLTDVTNIDKVQLGSLVQGTGVGREVYVKSINVGAKTITLTSPINRPRARQKYRLVRFKFVLDCSGMGLLSRFEIRDIDFQCNGRASAYMMSPDGFACKFQQNWVHEPKDRAILSYKEGCQALAVDNCLFKSCEGNISAKDRTSIAISTRWNDVRLRGNHAAWFRHFAYMSGGNQIILGNHFYQGNSNGTHDRTAGLILTFDKPNATIVSNYIDNCWIELTGELEPDYGNRRNGQIGQLQITGNTFLCHDIEPSFRFIKLRPNGPNVKINGASVINNTFASWGSPHVERVEGIDNSIGSIDNSAAHVVRFEGNSFLNINKETHCPAVRRVNMSSANANWTVNFDDVLPFGLQAMTAQSVALLSNMSSNNMPKVKTAQGSNGRAVTLSFPGATSGSAIVTVSADDPV